MVQLLKGANLALGFALELAMLAAYALWALGLDLQPLPRWGLAAGAVAAAIVAWGIWAAPNSATRLGEPGLTLLKLGLFALATAALFGAGRPGWATAFGLACIANLLLARFWGQG